MHIRLIIVLYTTIILSFSTDADTTAETHWQQQIDEQVWAPFVKAYETFDGPAFNALYADKVLRVTPDGIDTEGRFKADNLTRFAHRKNSNLTTELDFWFEHRQTIADTSYEVGYFRIRSTNDSDTNTFYGQFHIVVEKITGKWLITQDWDSDFVRGAKVSATDFDAQPPLVFD